VIISLHYVFVNKSVTIILLKTVDSHMCIWDCGNFNNLINDCPGIEDEEYQDYHDPYADPDMCG
jgi:hypothetical protein